MCKLCIVQRAVVLVNESMRINESEIVQHKLRFLFEDPTCVKVEINRMMNYTLDNQMKATGIDCNHCGECQCLLWIIKHCGEGITVKSGRWMNDLHYMSKPPTQKM